MSELGSGLSLDEQWDLYVDSNSGDLATDSGSGELRKDLAFNVALLLQPFVGELINDGTRKDIRFEVKREVEGDVRIAEVNSVRVKPSAGDLNKLSVAVRATTVDGVEIADVFTAA